MKRKSEKNRSFKSNTLAPVQRQTLNFLRNYIADNGYAPTLKDIAAHIGNIRRPAVDLPGDLIDIASVSKCHAVPPIENKRNKPTSATSVIAPSMSPVIHPSRFL